MQEILVFIEHHWALSLALLVILLLLVVVEFIKQKRGATRVSTTELTRMMNHENAAIIDVRKTDAFDDGHIVGSISLPLSDIEDKHKKIEKYKSQPIILVCANGIESQRAAITLAQKGYNLRMLDGGLRSWRNASLPLVKG